MANVALEAIARTTRDDQVAGIMPAAAGERHHVVERGGVLVEAVAQYTQRWPRRGARSCASTTFHGQLPERGRAACRRVPAVGALPRAATAERGGRTPRAASPWTAGAKSGAHLNRPNGIAPSERTTLGRGDEESDDSSE